MVDEQVLRPGLHGEDVERDVGREVEHDAHVHVDLVLDVEDGAEAVEVGGQRGRGPVEAGVPDLGMAEWKVV